MRVTRAAIAAVATLAACSSVTLRAPAPDAPAEARLDAYRRLRPTGRSSTVTLARGDGGGTRTATDAPIVLADGTVVRHADDLLPVVRDDSDTARAARASRAARQRKWTILGAGLAVAVGGLALAVTSFDDDVPPQFYGGLVALGAGMVVGGIGSRHYSRRESELRQEAFGSFDDGLRTQLDLCVEGIRVVACRAGEPPGLTR